MESDFITDWARLSWGSRRGTKPLVFLSFSRLLHYTAPKCKKTRSENLSQVLVFALSFLARVGGENRLCACSKSDGSQALDLQHDALLAAGVEADRIYSDLDSGRKDDRPGLAACLKSLQPDNTLVVWKLGRLGRSLKHLVEVVDNLSQRGVGLKVLTGAGAQIDTTTANGRLVFGIFAALAEFEAELIRERTRAGLAAARAGSLGWATTQGNPRGPHHGHVGTCQSRS